MSPASFTVFLILGLTVACSSPSPDPYQPLTAACDSCLLESGAEGCGESYEACAELDACERVVLCELQQQCYVKSSDSDCSVRRGCEDEASEQDLMLAARFESCARTTCAEPCFFVE